MNLPAKQDGQRGQATRHDDNPKLGQWFWVKVEAEEDGRRRGKKIETEWLMCATHIGSNYVEFEAFIEGQSYNNSTSNVRYLNRHLLANIRPEPNWKSIIEKRVEAKKIELSGAVAALAESFSEAGISGLEIEAPSLLPALTSTVSPADRKKALINLKEKTFPANKDSVENIIQEMVGLQKSLFLAERAKVKKLTGAIEEVDQRLFALELYAGLCEEVFQIRDGEAAPQDTPITVRQMLLYMDEETLFDLDTGGMDYKNIEDFDAWVSKPENANRLIPESKCVVAFKVRRHEKEYPMPSDISGFLNLLAEHEENKRTYLLIRNGEKLFRMWTEMSFDPRLLPFRSEFHSPLVKKAVFSSDKDKVVTPDDFEFDDCANERRKTMRHYNRILFLIQGLLDRSKVFNPHPPINIGDADQADKWFKAIHDEEDGLPSANPPKWEEYRDRLNAGLRVGTMAYCNVGEQFEGYSRDKHRKKRGYWVNERPRICAVSKISRDRKFVTFSWPWGTRHGREFKTWGKWGEWPVKRMCRQKVEINQVLNIEGYKLGDYKQFLCDHYLKGAYLQWAPPLLRAEAWHQEKAREANAKK